MELVLYKTADENSKLEKTLSEEVSLVGALKDGCSITAPSIMLQQNPIGYNYAYIPAFNRYYYIKNVTVVRKNIFMITLSVDVLMSFKDEIKELSGVVSRLTSGSPYAERDVLCSVKETHRRIDFPETPFTADGTYILVAQGGEETVTSSGGNTDSGSGGTTDSGGTGGGTGGGTSGTTDSGGDGF